MYFSCVTSSSIIKVSKDWTDSLSSVGMPSQSNQSSMMNIKVKKGRFKARNADLTPGNWSIDWKLKTQTKSNLTMMMKTRWFYSINPSRRWCRSARLTCSITCLQNFLLDALTSLFLRLWVSHWRPWTTSCRPVLQPSHMMVSTRGLRHDQFTAQWKSAQLTLHSWRKTELASVLSLRLGKINGGWKRISPMKTARSLSRMWQISSKSIIIQLSHAYRDQKCCRIRRLAK